MTVPSIRDNTEAHRYEPPVGTELAVVTCNLTGQNLMITETLAPEAFEGQGIASRLAEPVVGDARDRGLMTLPVCPFFSAYLQKHPEHADVVHPTYRQIPGLAWSVLIKDALSVIPSLIRCSGAGATVTLSCDDPPLTNAETRSYFTG